MKKFNQKQKVYFGLMTLSMILVDILICFSNETLNRLGIASLLFVIIFGYLFCQETKHSKKRPSKK